MKAKVWLILFLAAILVRAQTANFLLVEHPEALKILNVYRQQLSDQQKRALGKWLPFELKKVTTLSDNVTRVLETRVLNETYFLLLDAEGQPIDLKQSGAWQWIYRATLLLDTLQVQPGYQLSLLDPKSKTKIATLQAGQWVVRIFKKGRQYFVSPLSSKPLFGFVRLQTSKAWKKSGKKNFNKSRTWQKFLENLQFLLKSKNEVYQKLYTYFNQEQEIQNIPHWQLRTEADKVILIFNRPELLKQWPSSTQIFLKEVDVLAQQNKLRLVQKNDFTLIIERSH